MSVTTIHERFNTYPEYQRRWFAMALSVILVVLGWEAVGQVFGSIFFAPLSEVIPTYIRLATEQNMYPLLIKSLGDMFIGFLISASVAVPTGLVMGRSNRAEKMLNPWVSVLFVTSTASMMPIFIVLFGIGFALRIAIVILSSVLHITLNVYHGAKGVNTSYIRVGESFGTSRSKMFRKIVLPATFPSVMAGLRMGISRSFRGIILIETFILVGYGGFLGAYGRQSISTAPVLALLVNVMILAYFFRVGLERIQKRVAPWADAEPAL